MRRVVSARKIRLYDFNNNILEMNMKKNFYILASLLLTASLPAVIYCAEPQKTETQSQAHLEVPWLSTYYIQPQVTEAETVKVGFYVTDWHQSEYRLMDDSHRFHVTLKIRKKEFQNRLTGEEKVLEKRGIKAGDHEFDAGTFPEGEYQIALTAEDMQGRKSASIFHEFQVKKDFSIPDEETYRMKKKNLKKYRISNQGDLGIFHFVNTKGLSREETAARIEEAAKTVNVPAGKYVVVAGAEKYDPEENKNHRGAKDCPVPEWLPNSWSWRSCKVIYADDYDKKKAEADAVATGEGLNRFLEEMQLRGFRKVVMLPGTYRISHTTPLRIPSGMTVDLNGAVIKLNQYTGAKGMQIEMIDCFDSHVVNGIVEGDYFEHDYKNSPNNSEWVCGIGMSGETKYSSFERILVRYITGYGVTHGFHGHYASHTPIPAFDFGTVDEKNGELLPNVPGLAVSDMVGVAGYLDDGGYVAVSRFLGYQGMVGGRDWSLRYHFYDDGGKYLETIYGRQYRRMRVPEKAGYMRVSAYIHKDPPYSGDLRTNLFRAPWNSWYKNLFILSARCVGMAPSAMYNFKVENCSFVRSGENAAKCAFDAEDGWDMMQDVWFVRNKFFKNPVNEFLCCAGHNFIFEDNEGRFHLWNRTNSYVVRNNVWTAAFYGAGATRARTGLVRISGNTYTGRVQLGDRPAIPKKGADYNAAFQNALAAVDPAQWETGDEAVETHSAMPWFITMKDAEKAPELGCGPNAMLTGAAVKDMKKSGTFNLLGGTLEGTRKTPLSGSKFIKSKLIDIEGFVNRGALAVSGSGLQNVKISLGGDGSIIIRDSKLQDVTIHIGYWTTPVKVILENCVIENTDKPLINTGVYSIGEFKFTDCEIDTGTAAPINIYDMRQNNNGSGKDYEKQPGTVSFENCTVSNRKKCIVSVPAKGESRKKITVTAKVGKFPGHVVEPEVEHWEIVKDRKSDTDKDNKKSLKNKKSFSDRKNRKSAMR